MGNVNNWNHQKKMIETAAKNWKSSIYELVEALKFVSNHKSTWPKGVTSFHQIWDNCDMQGFTWQKFNMISSILADYGRETVEEVGWEAMSVMFRNRILDTKDVAQFVERCRDWMSHRRRHPSFSVSWALAREVLPGKVAPPITPTRARILQLEALVRRLQSENTHLRNVVEELLRMCRRKKVSIPKYLRASAA
jgi:hypothetical protein